MTRKITRISTQDYTDSQVLTLDADKQTIAEVLAFIAELNKRIQPVTDQEPSKTK